VAIDRAIVLPNEYSKKGDRYDQDHITNSQLASGVRSSVNQDAVRSRDRGPGKGQDRDMMAPMGTESHGIIGEPDRHWRQRSMTLEAVPEASMSTPALNAAHHRQASITSSSPSMPP
jgi:hypothetical protein